MDIFVKTSAGILITVIICLLVGKQQKDISILILILACAMISTVAFSFLKPIIDLIKQLSNLGNLNAGFMEVILKATGIGILSGIVTQICADAGYATLGKVLQLLATCLILYISIPLISKLIDLVSTILGEI